MPDHRGYSLGGLAAERDPLLQTCFVRSELIDRSLSFGQPQNIVVGKKGSGKSAIFLVGLGEDSDVPCIRMSPSTHRVNLNATGLSHIQYADVIQYELILKCLQTWAGSSTLTDKLTSVQKASLRNAAQEYLKRIKEAGVSVEGVDIFGLGLSLSRKGDSSVLELVSKSDMNSVVHIVNMMIEKGAKCLLLVDDPELLFGLSENPPPAPLIGGLLTAASNLTFKFSGSIKVVVFLKLHVYHRLKRTFVEIDHLRQDFTMLRWAEEDLENLIRMRLEKTMDGQQATADPWQLLLQEDEGSDSDRLRDHVLDRLVSGPRDLIWFASLILQMRNRGYRGWDAVESAEASYSSDQLEQLELQYGTRGYEGISNVVQKLFDVDSLTGEVRMNAREFDSFLKDRLLDEPLMRQRAEHDWLEALVSRTLAVLLFECGVLQYWSPGEHRYVRPYEVNSDREGFLASERWRLNPAFNRALDI